MTIAIVDYGAGNLASVVKAFALLGTATRVVARSSGLTGAQAIVVPGVGHFDATSALDDDDRRRIGECVAAGVPLLGICLGMQWLFEGSDEAPDRPGLGVLPGRCSRLAGAPGVKIPHVGWNTLERANRGSRLLESLPDGAFAYFTHSFAAPLTDAAVATTTHGATFASVVERGRVFGAQCHPEKSGTAGKQLLAAFVAIAREAGARC
jgi:glutamine amidotransferase